MLDQLKGLGLLKDSYSGKHAYGSYFNSCERSSNRSCSLLRVAFPALLQQKQHDSLESFKATRIDNNQSESNVCVAPLLLKIESLRVQQSLCLTRFKMQKLIQKVESLLKFLQHNFIS